MKIEHYLRVENDDVVGVCPLIETSALDVSSAHAGCALLATMKGNVQRARVASSTARRHIDVTHFVHAFSHDELSLVERFQAAGKLTVVAGLKRRARDLVQCFSSSIVVAVG